jgi:creatinine amidohydrolase
MSKLALAEMTWTEVRDAIAGGARVVVLPIGSTEQHGPHLPLSTDTLMAETAARGAAERAGGVLVAPTIPYGTSESHRGFAGTASLQLSTLSALLVDIGRTLSGHGFDVIVLLNGHAGNTAAIAAASHELRQVTDKVIAALTWWSFVDGGYRAMEDPIIWHAGEFETSLMLHLHPGLVQMERAVKDVPRMVPLFPGSGAAPLPKVDLGVPPTKAVVDSGVFGDARLAPAEKGKGCVEEALDQLVHVFRELRARGEEIRQRSRVS